MPQPLLSMTTKASAPVAAAKKKLLSRIAAAQRQADLAKKTAKLAKLGLRTAKDRFKAAKRAAKKLRKAVKALKVELAGLGAAKTPRKRAAPKADVYEVMIRAGHFGLVVGSKAATITWPTVADWVLWISGRDARPVNIEPMPDSSADPADSGVALSSRVMHGVAEASELAISLAKGAAVLFTVPEEEYSFSRSLAAPMSLVQTLATATAARLHPKGGQDVRIPSVTEIARDQTARFATSSKPSRQK